MSDVLIAVLAVAGVVGGGGGALTVYIQNRSTRPSGWERAVAGLEKQVDDLKSRVENAERRASAAERRALEVQTENHGLNRTIEQLTKSADAKDGRIVQLMTAWPPGSSPPTPNPAHEPYL